MVVKSAEGKGISARRVLASLQMVSMALLIGMSLYIYNDWRVHRTLAAPANGSPAGSNQGQGVHTTVETPLDLGNQGVSGSVEVDPDGTIKPGDGGKPIPGQPAIAP